MISFIDHLRTQVRLLYDADLRRVWPQVMEKAGRPRLHIRFKVLQCNRLSGAEIKRRYQWPAIPPADIKALKDMDRYLSVLVLLTKTYTGREHACVKGVFDLKGGAVILIQGQVWSPATLQNLHFWHHAPETRWSSRKDMMDDLAVRLRAVAAAEEAWLRKMNFEKDSMELKRTTELLSGLEAGLGHKELAPLLQMFAAIVFGREPYLGGLVYQGLLSPDFEERTSDLVKRLGGVLS
jgi:hypothetical protein